MLEHVIITGGNGYIGRAVAAAAIARGICVTVLGRFDRDLPSGTKFAKWQLGDAIPAEALSTRTTQRTALIHLAHDWSNRPANISGDAKTLNESGTLELWRSARAAGIVNLVFVSSQSARKDAINLYGRTKWLLEQRVKGSDTRLARVGLVYGGRASGLFALMMQLVKMPVLPMVASNQQVQPIHIDEVSAALLQLTQSTLERFSTEPVELGVAQPVSFGNVLRVIARETGGRSLFIVPVPLWMALLGCRLTSYIPFIPNVDRERVLGLFGVQAMRNCAADLAALNVKVRPMAENLCNSRLGARALLVEARSVLHFILGFPPSASLMRLYVRSVRRDPLLASPLGLSPLAIMWPGALRFQQSFRSEGRLERRLDMAATLTDASPDGTNAFLGGTQLTRLLRLVPLLFLELVAMPFRVIASLKSKILSGMSRAGD